MRIALLVVATLAAFVLAYAALDDITTGNESSFALEWTMVGAVALWVVFVTGLWLRHRARTH